MIAERFRPRIALLRGFVQKAQVRPNGSQALTAILGLAILGVSGSLLLGPNGLRRLRELRTERQQLAENALLLMDGNRRLREEIDRLQHDPEYLERIARRELQRVQPNEVVYRFNGSARR